MVNLIYTILPIITLIVGFYFGFKIGKENEIPKTEVKSPIKIMQEYKEKKEEKKKADEEEQLKAEMTTYLENIDNYPFNQKKIN